jgi:hypothetical protein
MDGVGVRGVGSGLGAEDRRLVLRLVRSDEDPEPLLDLFEKAHQETRFNYIPFSRDKARRLLRQVMAEDARHLVAVAEVGGKPEGFVYASVGEYFVGTDALIVTINVIYTSPPLRNSLLGGKVALRLFMAVDRWSKEVGAREILLHVTSGIEPKRLWRTVGRIGLRTVGATYVKRIGWRPVQSIETLSRVGAMTSFLSPKSVVVLAAALIPTHNVGAQESEAMDPLVGQVCAVANFRENSKILCERGAARLIKTEDESLQVSFRLPTKQAFGDYLLSQKPEDDDLVSSIFGRLLDATEDCAKDPECNNVLTDFFPSGIATCLPGSSVADVEVLLALGSGLVLAS